MHIVGNRTIVTILV